MAQSPGMVIRVAADISELKRNLAEGKAQIETTTAAMQRMAGSLSGEKLIQSAQNITAAVHQIGGASKLTEAEKARLNATLDKAIQKYAALGREAPPAMVALHNETKRTNAEVAKQPDLLDKVNTKAVALGAAIGSFMGNIAWSAVNKLGAEVSVFVQRGSQLGALQNSFERLARGANQSSTEMLSALKDGTRGLVSEYDLMTSANKAMLLGLPVTTESMGTMAKAATTLGKAMGLDATKSIDDLITALGRSSPMILDNLGLTVKVGEANEIYARKLGKTVDQLTDAEKKTAFYEEAMRKAELKTEQLGEQTKTLGEILNTTWVSFGNIVTRVASDLDVGIGAALSSLEQFKIFLAATLEGGASNAIAFMAQMERAKNTIGTLTDQQKKWADGLKKLGDSNKYIAETLQVSQGTIDAYFASLNQGAEAQDKADDGARKLADAFQKQVDVLTGKALAREVEELARQVDVAGKQGGLSAYQFDLLGKKLADLRTMGADLPPMLFQIAAGWEDNNRKALPLVSTLQSVNTALKAVYATAMTAPPSLMPGLTDIEASVESAFQAVKGAVLTKAPAAAKEGASSFVSSFGRGLENLPNVIVGAIQGGGNALQAGIASIGAAVGGWLTNHIKQAMGGGLLGSLLGGLAGTGVTLIASKIGNLFGGNDTKKTREQLAKSMGFGSLDSFYRELRTMGEEGQKLVHQGLNVIGKKDTAAQSAWTASVMQLFEDYKRKAAEATAVVEEGQARERAAIDATKAAIQSKIDAVKSEYDSVHESIREELENPEYDETTGERIYGVIEAQGIARMEQLAKEQELLELQMKATGEKVLSEAEIVREGMDKIFSKAFEVPVVYTATGTGMPSGGARFGGAMANGGDLLVNRPTWFLAGEDGPERATFTPVGRPSSGSGGSTGPIHITVVSQLDGREVARNQVRYMPGQLRLAGGVA